MKKLIVILILTFATSLAAHDYVPGVDQTTPILLKGGDLHTVANGVMPSTDILFDKGLISAIGINLDFPENTKVVDVTGHQVYPGLIDSYTALGLIEIGAVRATNDLA